MTDAPSASPPGATFSVVPTYQERLIRNRIGLRLYTRSYPGPAHVEGRTPVLCLPGLTRNSRDFDRVAARLAADRPVYTLDARGRGGSDYAPDPKTYTLPHEMNDVIDVLAALDVSPVAILGTSRGGMVAHLLAAAMPGALAAVVLNDIGPKLEAVGLNLIASYVGKIPTPATWGEAAELLERAGKANFPRLTRADWEAIAHQRWNEKNGAPAPGYDQALGTIFDAPATVAPDLWKAFGALSHVPLLVIRAALSDLITAEAVAEMVRRHPNARSIEVPDEGHAPLLNDAPTQEAIAGFLNDVDRARAGRA